MRVVVTMTWFKGRPSTLICKRKVWNSGWLFCSGKWEWEYWWKSKHDNQWSRVPRNYYFEKEPT